MNEAKESVKTLNAQLKANESQLKLNGDQETYLKNKVQLLNQQIEAQKTVVANAMKALQEMKSKGVKPTDTSYQKLKQSVYNATDQLNKMQTELKDVETGADNAGKEAGEMNTELQNIGKNVAWGNVAEGLDSITRKLESGARAAVNFGKKVLSSAKDSTQWADDLQTTVKQYSDMGLTSDSLQRMQKVEDFIDAPVEAILNAKARMQKATATKGGVKAFEEILGINLNGQNTEDLFWETGEAILGMGEAFDKEAAAQQIFGRSWRELLPLFMTGREEYEKMLDEQNVLTDEQVQSLAEADDALKKAEQQIADLKNQFWAENADKITGLMQWFVDNEDGVVTALTAIGGAFAAMKLAEFGANLMKVVSGFQALGWVKGGDVTGGTEAEAVAGGPKWASILNKVTLFAAASEMYKATEGKIKKVFDEFKNATAGMSSEDASVAALMHDLGITEEEARNMVQSPGKGTSNGKSFGQDWRPSYMRDQSYYNGPGKGDEVIHKDRRAVNDSAKALEESLGRMSSEMTQSAAGQTQSNTEVAAAITGLTGLPAAISTAVQAGMSQVTIVISEAAVGTIGRKVGRSIGNQVQALVK
jgi:hypothetical protein